MMRKCLISTVTAMAATVVVACGSPAHPPGIAENCSGTFSFYSREEPLGSNEALVAAVREFSAQTQPVPLSAVTAMAGWSGEWDRMLTVHVGTDREALNAAAGLSEYCWPDLPRRNYDASHFPEFHVFIQGGIPRQAVVSAAHKTLFDATTSQVLYADSMLEPVPQVNTRPGYLQPIQ